MLRIALFSLACLLAVPASGEPLVPADFDVPEVLETDRVRLRMLTVNDVVRDCQLCARTNEAEGTVHARCWPLAALQTAGLLVN